MDWPVTLPTSPLESAYSSALAPSLVEAKTDTGYPKRHRRFTSSLRTFVVGYWLEAAQRTILDTFYATVKKGEVPFVWTDPRTFISYSVYFDKPPAYSAEGDGFRVTLQFSTQEGQI